MSDRFLLVFALSWVFIGWIAGLLTARDFPALAKSITHPNRKTPSGD